MRIFSSILFLTFADFCFSLICATYKFDPHDYYTGKISRIRQPKEEYQKSDDGSCYVWVEVEFPDDISLILFGRQSSCLSTKTLLVRGGYGIKDSHYLFPESPCIFSNNGFVCICFWDYCNSPKNWNLMFFMAAVSTRQPKGDVDDNLELIQSLITIKHDYGKVKNARLLLSKGVEKCAIHLMNSFFVLHPYSDGFITIGKTRRRLSNVAITLQEYRRQITPKKRRFLWRLYDDRNAFYTNLTQTYENERTANGYEPEFSEYVPKSASLSDYEAESAEGKGSTVIGDDDYLPLEPTDHFHFFLVFLSIFLILLVGTVLVLMLFCQRLTHHNQFRRVPEIDTVLVFGHIYTRNVQLDDKEK